MGKRYGKSFIKISFSITTTIVTLRTTAHNNFTEIILRNKKNALFFPLSAVSNSLKVD